MQFGREYCWHHVYIAYRMAGRTIQSVRSAVLALHLTRRRARTIALCGQTVSRASSSSYWNSDDYHTRDMQTIVVPQYKPKDPQETVVKKRARLTWQSRKRGIKENCLIFGSFADKYLKDFTKEQLDMYDKLLNKADSDWEMYYWMTGTERVPEMFDNEVMKLLQVHCKNEEKSERFEQPPLNYEPVEKR